MEPVTLDEPQYAPRPTPEKKIGRVTRLVIALGVAKDEQGALWVMSIFAAVLLGLSALIFVMSGSGVPPAAEAPVNPELP